MNAMNAVAVGDVKAQVVGAANQVAGQVVGAVAAMAPDQQLMGVDVTPQGVIVKQHTSECCRCCCCQPNIDWDIHDFREGNYDGLFTESGKMFIKEESSWLGRCMSFQMPGHRATKYTVYEGGAPPKDTPPTGRVLFIHEKGCSCPVNVLIAMGDGGQLRVPCCFQPMPYLITKDANGTKLGTSKYVCDMCLFIPKFDVFDANDQHVYRVRPEVCLGCCPKCNFGGAKGKCMRIPFPIREPKEPYNQIKGAVIGDLWAGVKHECCTKKNLYELKYPPEVVATNNQAMKATLFGTALLVDITTFEQDQ
eukprot:gnl/MRDRNA2_/MRDRNA2_97202_c0_seq1.p1 gnl/MRDRNA2_/MRDRNA2_97202_c0~~gnl/MRDRNA2_/MRDRNA2_97202_c0_seq1.p1  ORF type:complete len:307 (+),score=48.82 gnl/MRDRNA2_/MRDRNA2_97202_c0_seq1:106-1026(+)